MFETPHTTRLLLASILGTASLFVGAVASAQTQSVDGYLPGTPAAEARPIPTRAPPSDRLPDDLETQLPPVPDRLPAPARATSPFAFVIDGGWATVVTNDALVHGGYLEAGVTIALGSDFPGMVGGMGWEFGLLGFGLLAPGAHGPSRLARESIYSDTYVPCRPIESAAAGGLLLRNALTFASATFDFALGPAFATGPRRSCENHAATFDRSNGNPYLMLTMGMEVGFDRARTISLRGGGYVLLSMGGGARESSGAYAGIGLRL